MKPLEVAKVLLLNWSITPRSGQYDAGLRFDGVEKRFNELYGPFKANSLSDVSVQ